VVRRSKPCITPPPGSRSVATAPRLLAPQHDRADDPDDEDQGLDQHEVPDRTELIDRVLVDLVEEAEVQPRDLVRPGGQGAGAHLPEREDSEDEHVDQRDHGDPEHQSFLRQPLVTEERDEKDEAVGHELQRGGQHDRLAEQHIRQRRSTEGAQPLRDEDQTQLGKSDDGQLRNQGTLVKPLHGTSSLS